ncbi:MAG TPA: hypothetical protein PKC19_09405, partial [Roseiflexaceae bacterium]|nr:hypothetical protein [Roseiflexaceae bacterium]
MSRLKRYQIELLIFVLLLACYSYVPPRWADWNQNSRMNLVLAIVDDGTFAIDRYRENTGDYALFEGHYYSDKAPGASFLAVPVYAVVRPLLQSAPVGALLDRLARSAAFGDTLNETGTGLQREKIYYAIALTIVTFATVAIPAALLGVLLYRFLAAFDPRRGWRVAATLIYGLATPAFPYANLLYGHQTVAVMLFAAFALSFWIGQRRIRPAWATLVGLLLGYVLITEYPAALIIAAIGLYLIAVIPDRRWIAGTIAAGIPPLLLMMAYNWSIFRTVLPVGYKYSELWVEEHQSGFMSLAGPNVDALWGITFGAMRGLFYVAPILLLALPGFIFWWRSGRLRAELFVCLWAMASFLLFNGSSVMWWGGFGVGPRYLVPMLPFMAVAMAVCIQRVAASRGGRILVAILAFWSWLVIWAQSLGGQSFPQFQPDPLFSYSLPELAAGNIARNLGMAFNLDGWASLVPLALVATLLGGMLLRILVAPADPGPAATD